MDSKMMEKTIVEDELVYINKTKFGIRFPITLLSVPFFSNLYSPLIQLPYFRIPKFSGINHNHLIAFNTPGLNDLPIDKKPILVKRCVGLPGDNLQIQNKKVFINQKEIENPVNIQHNYRITTNGCDSMLFTTETIRKYGITQINLVAEIGVYDLPLTKKNAQKLKTEPYIMNLRKKEVIKGNGFNTIFPQSGYFHWNKDYFGAVSIPKKGATVSLNHKNIYLYKKIIEIYESNFFEIKQNKIFINNSETQTYTFKKNYYFVLDDNRDNANDSRHWGFLPEDHIIGGIF
jgi:signal peptidase I